MRLLIAGEAGGSEDYGVWEEVPDRPSDRGGCDCGGT
jgi:hypothetical protein